MDCSYEGGRTLHIHPDEYVDCEPVWPTEAIYYEEDLPDAYRPYQVRSGHPG